MHEVFRYIHPGDIAAIIDAARLSAFREIEAALEEIDRGHPTSADRESVYRRVLDRVRAAARKSP